MRWQGGPSNGVMSGDTSGAPSMAKTPLWGPSRSTLNGIRHGVDIVRFADTGTRKPEIELAITRTHRFEKAKCGDAKPEGLRRLLSSSRAVRDLRLPDHCSKPSLFRAAIKPSH